MRDVTIHEMKVEIAEIIRRKDYSRIQKYILENRNDLIAKAEKDAENTHIIYDGEETIIKFCIDKNKKYKLNIENTKKIEEGIAIGLEKSINKVLKHRYFQEGKLKRLRTKQRILNSEREYLTFLQDQKDPIEKEQIVALHLLRRLKEKTFTKLQNK